MDWARQHYWSECLASPDKVHSCGTCGSFLSSLNDVNGLAGSVAVVITTFNDAHFLATALSSVVAQREAPREIIVVDDGSDENPEPILADFPGARLLLKENGGLSSARNAGLRSARSEFIAFLDADDRLEPNAISDGLACFERVPQAVMVYGGHRRIDVAGKPLSPDFYQECSDDPFADLLAGNIIGMHASVLYRRQALVDVGGFDSALRRCEDYDLYLRLARDYRIASHPGIVAEYRWHGKNMSADKRAMLRAVRVVHDRFARQTGERRIAWVKGRRNWKLWYTKGQDFYWGIPPDVVSARKRARSVLRWLKRRALRYLPKTAQRQWPPEIGNVNFGQLSTTRPISNDFGWERGTPIDRYYIEKFLATRADDINGRVLEIGDDAYSRQFGGDRVTKQDILHVDPANSRATLVGDLISPNVLPAIAFDCIVLTQTLQLIFELEQAVDRLYDALKPGGVLLLTVPGISQIDRQEWRSRWCWSFTEISIRRLFEIRFTSDALEVQAHGNVFAAIAYLTGAVLEDVDVVKLDVRDTAYPVVVTLRAKKI
jgi:glycosyltransferase involved in cell wall biosynthesis/SAM-dependent methyltransferase